MTESLIVKKVKISEIRHKRSYDSETKCSISKRSRTIETEENLERKIITLKRKNFIKACEQVSYNAYYDHKTRFMLHVVPDCVKGDCLHQGPNKEAAALVIPAYVEESFKIEFKSNMWCDVLDVCQMCITRRQYLSANVLKDIVEILLNAHEDSFAGYSIPYLLDKCKQILSLSFRKHPPCLSKSLKKCYNNFLTSPMDFRDNTFTNRTEFNSDKGIVKYCWDRLDYEMTSESKDEPLVDKTDYTPEEMKQTVKGLYWQKEKFEIFEALPRVDRIDRLLIVLESLSELLQLDLAIWHSKHTSNQGRQIMRSQRPLMAFVLWTDNVLYTGAVNNNCRQIMRIFADFICLQYPKRHINTMTLWINLIIQTFYICETNSNSDFPNMGKYSGNFANEFYKIIKDLPTDQMIKVVTQIQPSFMRYLLGQLHLKTILNTKEDDVLKITIDFLKNGTWNEFPASSERENFLKPNVKRPKSLKRLYPYLSKVCRDAGEMLNVLETQHNHYPKRAASIKYNDDINQSQVINLLYLTFEAYLDAFNVYNVQNTIEIMNESLNVKESEDLSSVNSSSGTDNSSSSRDYSYSVTETFIKKYRTIYQLLKDIITLLPKMKADNELTDDFEVFENIVILDLMSINRQVTSLSTAVKSREMN